MADRAALHDPLAHRRAQAIDHHARPEQLAQRRDLRSGRLVGLAIGVDEQRQVEVVLLLEVLRVLGRALPDHRELHAGGLELVPVAVQLHRVLAAEQSAVVAEEDEHRGPLRPQVAEPHVRAGRVLEHDVRDRRGVGGCARLPLLAADSEHAANTTAPHAPRINRPMSDAATPTAVIDIGTNSTRLLVARIVGSRVEELERESIVTRLGQGVDSTGRLADEAVARVFDVLGRYRELIDAHGGEDVVALATSAVRDSSNGDDFRAAVRDRFGFDLRIISGDEEARLTFLGATSARAENEGPALVIDIGGGSTELVVGRPGADPDFHVSTQAGSVRQTERHLHDDPPAPSQLEELRGEVRGIVEENVPADVRGTVAHGIAVAGTATQLAAVDRGRERRDGDRLHGYVLERRAVAGLLERLGAVPLDERRHVPGLDPDRAPTIVAGAAILLEVMEAFSLDRVETSETDILHGAALVARRTENG
jgi:exopolyphosphatase/guanosine-5'-triphosphate,3'-diphosphate pyrophosphatase